MIFFSSISFNVSDTDFTCIVESDYTVVFFAAGNKNSPGWNWMWKAYRTLSRKFRKNLKKLVGSLTFALSVMVSSRLAYPAVHRPLQFLLKEFASLACVVSRHQHSDISFCFKVLFSLAGAFIR